MRSGADQRRRPPAEQEVTDPAAELRQLAGLLAQAYGADPGNALLARELRMTLQALMPKPGTGADDDLENLYAELGSA